MTSANRAALHLIHSVVFKLKFAVWLSTFSFLVSTYTHRNRYGKAVRSAGKPPGIPILLHLFFVFSVHFQRYIKVLNLMEQMPCHHVDFLKLQISINSEVLFLASTISKRHEVPWKLPKTVPHPNRISQKRYTSNQLNSSDILPPLRLFTTQDLIYIPPYASLTIYTSVRTPFRHKRDLTNYSRKQLHCQARHALGQGQGIPS